MRVLHVLESLEPVSGGPSKSVPDLAARLEDRGVRASLVAVQVERTASYDLLDDYGLRYRIVMMPATIERILPLCRYFIAPGLRRAIDEEALSADLMHLCGLWGYPGLLAWRIARRRSIPLIFSPRASLLPSSLAHSALRKKAAWRLYVRRMVGDFACLHATSPDEVEALRALGIRQPIALVPNFVHVDEYLATEVAREEAISALGLPADRRYLLFLSRIHPRKRLDWLVEAFASLCDEHPDWTLLVAGPHELPAYVAGVRDGVRRRGLEDRVRFLGMLERRERALAYYACELFANPSAEENFGMTIFEALAAARPAITTTGAPWARIPAVGAGWRIEPTREALRKVLGEALALSPHALADMGRRGRSIAQGMTGTREVEQMRSVYAWVLDREPKPDCVV